MKARQTGQAAERLFQKAMAAQAADDFAEAERLYRLSMALAPSQSGPRHNLGALLRGLGRLEEARELLAEVLNHDPQLTPTRYALGMVLMALGDYRAGWPLYEARRSLPDLKITPPVLPFPEWRGEPLAGKRIVVFPEQGLGDNIQFARFALTLRDQGAQVLLLCRPPLERLLRHSLDGIEVQSASGTVELGEPDYWALFGSLPGPLGLTADAIPAAPYLRAPQPAVENGADIRIGLATRGNPAHQNDARRSLPPDAERRLRALPGIVSLHPDDSGARDFADTAAIIETLNLVISVDTSVAHLAGAMGKRGVVLLPGFATDWRWLSGREDSPWYPSLTLFRSTINGDWNLALSRTEAVVAELTKGPPPPT